jgi:hypothetical protein
VVAGFVAVRAPIEQALLVGILGDLIEVRGEHRRHIVGDRPAVIGSCEAAGRDAQVAVGGCCADRGWSAPRGRNCRRAISASWYGMPAGDLPFHSGAGKFG